MIRSELKLLVYLILSGLLLILGGVYFFGPSEFNERWMFFVSLFPILGYGVVCVAKMASAQGQGFAWFSIFNLFSFSFIIVHFQYPILALFYEEIASNTRLWNDPEVSTEAVTVGAIAYVIFLFGYVARLGRLTLRERGAKQVVFGPVEISKVFYLLFVGCLGAFALFLGLVGASFLSGAYAGSANWGAGATYLFLLFEILLYLAIILEIYRMRMENPNRGFLAYLFGFNKLLSMFMAAYILFQVYTGDRGPIVATGIIVIGGYDIYFRRLGLKFFIPLAVCGAVVLTLISQYRTRDATMTLEERVEKAKTRVEDKPFYEYTGDLATSIRTLNCAVGVTDGQMGYFKGLVIGGQVTGVVPFFQKFFGRFLPAVNGYRMGTTSSFINTSILHGLFNPIGAGTTVVADVYYDAGIFSVILCLFVIGYFQAWIETTAKGNHSIYRMVIALLVLTYALYWPRASFLGDLDFWVWSLGLVWILRTKVFRKMSFWRDRRPHLHLANQRWG